MKIAVILCILVPFFTKAQIVSTFAGGGMASGTLGDGGLATAANIPDPINVAFDKIGNCYVASGLGGNKIRKIDVSGIISTIAGTGTAGYTGDGLLATEAELNVPTAVAFDLLGNIYICDANNNVIRKIDVVSGIISTIAGTGASGYSQDNILATTSLLNDPNDICFDKFGNLYIADAGNNRIRKIDSEGIITTFAGNGNYGFSGDGGLAITAQIWLPMGLATDSIGNIYISDRGNFRIRKVDTNGIITTFAGNGNEYYTGDGISAIDAQFTPSKIHFNSTGDLFIGDDDINYRVLMVDNSGIIHRVAGDGIAGFSGDGGPSDSAEFYYPAGVTVDYCDNLYITDVNPKRIRKVSFNPACWPENVNSIIASTINIYPNPAYETINIDNVTTQTRYAIINITGIIEQSGTLKAGNNSIPVQALPIGIHLLQFTDNEGVMVVHKIVKQ